MINILIALALAFLGLSVVVILAVAVELARQNGRLLIRVEALEDALQQLRLVVAEREINAFLSAHPWLSLRDESNDLEILGEVVRDNCYRLPASFEKHDVVIDVGAHIGIFAMAALARGCGEVECFEPEPANVAAARHNLEPFGERARLTQAAVWRSDRPEHRLQFQPYAKDSRNLGGGDVVHSGGYDVPARGIDEILLDASHGGQRTVRLLKLDCEGAEYPILLTSERLDLVDEISGEYHEVPDEITASWNLGREFNIETLTSHLTASGFEVSWTSYENDSNAKGLFFARRRP